MTLPTRRFVEVVCDNPRHENWDDHEWQTDDCIVQVTEPLMSRAEWEATIDRKAAAKKLFRIIENNYPCDCPPSGHLDPTECRDGNEAEAEMFSRLVVDAALGVGEETP